jgi:hypothetical protein
MKHPHIIAILILLLTTTLASADPILRWAPADTVIALDEQVTLAVMLDDTLTVRTLELYVAFDPEVVGTIAGGYGDLFDGFNNFAGFAEVEPGLWHGYCVILGAGDWTTGPGELFRITVAGLAEGTSPLTTVELTLLPPGGGDYPDAVLPDGQIHVDDLTGVLPDALGAPQLSLYPNPFNPRTRVELSWPAGGQGRLEVLDLRGRLVAELWRGTVTTAPATVDWDGTDHRGRPSPSGVYTFRLVGARGQSASCRGVLLR